MNKSQLRRETVAFRRSLNSEIKMSKDNSIFQKLVSLDEYKNADTVLLYISREIEVNTEKLMLDAFSRGKTVAAPRCSPESNEIEFFVINSCDDLESGSFGIMEPKKECKKAVIGNKAFCVVPALCVDKNGYRLGFGKGFYDRFLSKNTVYSVCICYSDNVYDSIPKNSFDKAVDLVISD